MDLYVTAKFIHVVSATVLFGTGLGTAFHMWMAHLSNDPSTIARVARNVVIADWMFTTPAIIVQPLTGLWLILLTGYAPDESWLVAVYALYVLAGLCWLPVVWLQMRMRDLARESVRHQTDLDHRYHRYASTWFALGWPAFLSVVAIYWLMIAKPELW